MNRIRVCSRVCAEPFIPRKKSGVKAQSIFCIGPVKGSRQNRPCNISYDHIWKKQLLYVVTYGWVGTMPRNLNGPPFPRWPQKGEPWLRPSPPSSPGPTAQAACGEITGKVKSHPRVPRPKLLLGSGSWQVLLSPSVIIIVPKSGKLWMEPNPSA